MALLNIQKNPPEIYGTALQSGKNVFATNGPTEHFYSGINLTDLTEIKLVNSANPGDFVNLLTLTTGDFGISRSAVAYSERNLMFAVPKQASGTYHLQVSNQYGDGILQNALVTLQKPKIFITNIGIPEEEPSSSSSESLSSEGSGSAGVSSYYATQVSFSSISAQTDYDGTCYPFSYGFHYLPDLVSLNSVRGIVSDASENYSAGNFRIWQPCSNTNADDSYREVRATVFKADNTWTVQVFDRTYPNQAIYFHGFATQADFFSSTVNLVLNSTLVAGQYSVDGGAVVYTVGGSCTLRLTRIDA